MHIVKISCLFFICSIGYGDLYHTVKRDNRVSEFLDSKGSFKEISEKLGLIKNFINQRCYTAATSNFSNLVYSIPESKRLFVTNWGCTNTNGTRNNMVSGFVQMDNSISFLTDSKIMLVAKDSNQNIINTDNGGSQSINGWCIHIVDSNTSDNITVTELIDVDGDGTSETSIARLLKEVACSGL